MPAILDDGFALWESSAIAEYLEERYPQNPLLPKDVKARATARRLAAEAEAYLGPCVGHLVELALYAETPASPAEIEEAQAEGPGGAGALRRADDGPLSSWARCPWPISRSSRICACCGGVEDRKPGKGIGNDRLPPKLAAWVKQIEALPYYEKTIPPHWKG